MRSQRDIPGPWADRMTELGFTYHSRPSARSLADAAGVTVNAALRVIFRENFGDATVVALGKALRDERFVADWVAVEVGQEWTPPIEARLLTPQQRNLLDGLVRELAKGGQSDAGTAEAQKNPDRGGGRMIDFPSRGESDDIAAHSDESGPTQL